MNVDSIKELIIEIGFAPQDGMSGVFVKRYATLDNYPIFVDFSGQRIEYAYQDIPLDKRIRLGDLTTSNLDKPENLVVLECVDRLLTKGYRPERLELEKKYPLGRNLKGKLDILVYSENDDSPFLMIECKTWGSEFRKESARTLRDGGQLFSYYQQDRAAKFLCLYASRLDGKKVEYRNNIVLVEEAWRDLSSVKDIHGYWNKNFKDNGIFEEYATPYDVKPKALTYGMLKNLKEEGSGKIYNQIMEILRHNAISDKPNAFNKLLNLFVCKIIDETINQFDQLEFQWLETDDDETLQMRLNDLYKEGMWRFLEIRVIDHSEKDVADVLRALGIDDSAGQRILLDMFTDERLKKSPNFAFLEVQDEKTFRQNAKVVREIVELLQTYKFRYEQKHEFLGNFFELLLNTSMKQEAGQFFTPVPITRFIISSLPLREFVQDKIEKNDAAVLPAVIDFACGSGHFITEYMEQMQGVIDEKIDISRAARDVRGRFSSWQGDVKFSWAKDFVYGIDLDNRLVKTTKVSAFFNGDGEANVIWANGLDNFERAEEYRGLLKQTQTYDKKNNGQFDILISNPPYSVEAFKSTLKYGEETFELYRNVTDNSSEIECLFVERMKQLLRAGGWAGVILPSSILSNGGIHSKAREIVLKYFKVKAIVELGSGTFMKTGTNTVVFFLERRADNDFVAIEKAVAAFVANPKDVTVMGVENAFSKYVASAYDNLAFDDYVSFVSGRANAVMQKHELYADYVKAFGEETHAKGVALEKEKMLYFLLTYAQNIVLVKTGQKQEEKAFLGYEFSERRGHEGIKHLPGGTKLFDESGDLLNPKKVNSYIYNAFLGKEVSVDESLAGHVRYGRMSGFIHYGTSKFDRVVNLNKRQKVGFVSLKAATVLLGDISKIEKGQNLTSAQAAPGDIPVVAGGIRPSITHDKANRPAGVITVSASGANAGYVNYWDVPIFATDCNTIISADEKTVLTKYIFFCLSVLQTQIFGMQAGQAQPHVYEKDLRTIKIPLLPMGVQREIVAEMEGLEEEGRWAEKEVSRLSDVITKIVQKDSAFPRATLGQVVEVKGGKRLSVGESFSSVKTDHPYIRVSDFKEKSVDTTELKYISEAQYQKIKSYIINSTDVYISIAGTLGLAGSIPEFLDGANLTENAAKLVPDNKKIIREYLVNILCGEEMQKQIDGATVGLGTPKLSLERIKGLQIPLPSLDEQEKMVAEIEKIEADIKVIREKQMELKVQKDNVLQRYL